MAVTPDGRVFVANEYSGTVTVHDGSGNLQSTIGGMSGPTWVAVTPDGGRAYVTNSNGNSVTVISTSNNSVIANIGVGSLPSSVAITSDGRRAYVTNEYAFSVSVIDLGSGSVSTIDRIGVYPIVVATQPSSGGTQSSSGSTQSSSGGTQSSPAGNTQSFQVAPASTAGVPGGWAKVVSKNSGKCLDVTGYSFSAGTPLEQWSCWGGDNQLFKFSPVQGGYEITAKNSGLQVDVNGGPGATYDGARIIQWPYWGGSNEVWQLNPNSDGTYSIVASNSGKCLDVNGVSQSDGAVVQQWGCWGGDNQKWQLVPVQ